jgi:hypothetical protein
MKSKVKDYRAWFFTPHPLSDVGDKLVASGIYTRFYRDSENVYEWIICDTSDEDRQLNISRKHWKGNLPPDEPTVLLLMFDESGPQDIEVKEMAAKVAHALGVNVTLGTVEYLGGDDFRYHPSERIDA